MRISSVTCLIPSLTVAVRTPLAVFLWPADRFSVGMLLLLRLLIEAAVDWSRY